MYQSKKPSAPHKRMAQSLFSCQAAQHRIKDFAKNSPFLILHSPFMRRHRRFALTTPFPLPVTRISGENLSTGTKSLQFLILTQGFRVYNPSMAHPPKNLQAILWSTDINQLDIEKNKGYIIHQILLYGDLAELRWLFQTYSKRTIIDVFLSHPAKLYPKEIFRFVKDHILGLGEISLDESRYVAYTWQRFPGKFGPPPKRVWSTD